jgi:hypothetical protein
VGYAGVEPEDVDAGSWDACAFNVSITQGNFYCEHVGDNSVTLIAADVNGNSSTCDFTVTVEDNYAPLITCPADVLLNCEDDNTSSATGEATGYDNCEFGITESDQSTQDADPTSAGHYNYTITRTWTALDVNGNSASCDQIITVQDVTVPTFTAPDDITVYSDENCSYDASIEVTGDVTDENDNCSIGIEAQYFDEVFPGPTGSYVILRTWTLHDYSGNEADTVVQTITVSDIIDPTPICQDIILQLDVDGNGTITPADIDNGSYDNCEIASLSVSPDVFTCNEVGDNPVTLVVTDVNGNISACNAVVTVEDNVAPEAICRDILTQLDALGEGSIVPSQIDNGSNDACGIDYPLMTVEPNKFGCDNVGENLVTLTVYDVNGNVSTCDAIVTVQDKIVPESVCQNVTVELDAEGEAFVTASMIDNGSEDACGLSDLTANITNFTCANVGPNTVTLTVTDNNGNQSQCTSTVTVRDDITPTALCKTATVTLNNVGFASITPASVDLGSYDNCGIATMTVAPNTFGCANIGANVVTLTVTDVNGNVSTCAATTNVIGLIPACTIASIPSNGTFTGGVPTNIYLGYGPQSTTLKVTMVNGTPQHYSWTCSNPAGMSALSCTSGATCSQPVFTPTVAGNYTFTVTVTNNYGCVTTCSITICVLNVGGSGGRIYVAHVVSGNGNQGTGCNTLLVAASAIPAHLAHGDYLGYCAGTGPQICAPSAKSDEEATAPERILEEGGEFNVKVFPNPFSDKFHLSITSSNTESLEIKIFDVLGQLIEGRKDIAFESDVTFGTNLSKGIYLVEVTQGEKTQVIRVIKSE